MKFLFTFVHGRWIRVVWKSAEPTTNGNPFPRNSNYETSTFASVICARRCRLEDGTVARHFGWGFSLQKEKRSPHKTITWCNNSTPTLRLKSSTMSFMTEEEKRIDPSLGYPLGYEKLCRHAAFRGSQITPYSKGPPQSYLPYKISVDEVPISIQYIVRQIWVNQEFYCWWLYRKSELRKLKSFSHQYLTMSGMI